MGGRRRTNQKLVDARLGRGWTQNQVATAAHQAAAQRGLPEPGIDANQVSRWERGSKPHLYHGYLLCLAFGLPPSQLGLPQDSMPAHVLFETEHDRTITKPSGPARLDSVLAGPAGLSSPGQSY